MKILLLLAWCRRELLLAWGRRELLLAWGRRELLLAWGRRELPLLLAFVFIACDSKPEVEKTQHVGYIEAVPLMEGEAEAFGAFPDALLAAKERHSDKSFEAFVMGGPLRIRVEHPGSECVRQVPPGSVPAEWATNLDHTLDRCIEEIFKGK